ncbi:uncharacterized protein LOC143297990 [Babylonia areolata]|uniref:uncharacterized protein LOC143297990 n=1 Tax=Babylonia areolata TaxID=304850 RepID=UPI003FD2C1C8
MAYLQRKNIPRHQRMCMVCSQACSYSYKFCSHCCLWVHNNCDAVVEEKLLQFERLSLDFPYICRKCRSDDEGNFDFTKCLQRLHKAATEGIKKLRSCVKRELLFLDGHFVGFSGVGSLAVDSAAQFLMQNYLTNDKGIPAATSAMDHVLFRAVSLAVCAKDCLACELRVRTCIEMVTFEQYYRYQKNHEQLARFAPDYNESCIDCGLIDEGSSVWTMSALASVIRRPIMSVYPSVNGNSDPAVAALNRLFTPREGEVNCQLVRILWTSISGEISPGKWKPNHFVPIFDQQKAESPAKTPRKRPASEIDSSQEMDDFETVEDEDGVGEQAPVEMVQLEKAEGGQPIEYGKFMDVFEAFEKITTAIEVHADIPRGVKENVWFLIDNSHNVRHPERRNTFFDDCGVWDSRQGSVAKSYLLLDDADNTILCTLKLHDGLYRKHLKSNSKNEWVVLDPQPDPNRVVVCHRYYAFLKRCSSYKRRVIWFDMPHAEDKGSEVALVEYIGNFPGFTRPIHGNAKRGRGGKSNYVRTDPKLLDEIAKEIRSGNNTKPMKMYKQIQDKLGPSCTLRDARQIRNLKYSVLKRLKKEQRVEVGSKMDQEMTVVQADTPTEISIIEESGSPVVVNEGAVEDSATPFKVIIQHEQADASTTMESYESMAGITQGRLVELEEGQQAISFMNTDANGIP